MTEGEKKRMGRPRTRSPEDRARGRALLYLSPKTKRRLERYAFETKKTMSEVADEVLSDFLEKEGISDD